MPIAERVFIPLGEIVVRASRSSGPGGQHANVTASRIEAIFDVHGSRALSEGQKRTLSARLGSRVTAVAQDSRSQTQNRELALKRLQSRLRSALMVRAPRVATRPGRAAVSRRLEGKGRRASVKRARRPPGADD